MSEFDVIRDFEPQDIGWVHALNKTFESELSPLDATELQAMVDEAVYARVIGPDCAFLLAFDQRADYHSPNFIWFQEQVPKFIYVDRVAVANHARRRGLGEFLYKDLYRFAKVRGYPRVVAEINAQPPNPASDAFHTDQGFVTVGRQRLADRNKVVRYVEKPL